MIHDACNHHHRLVRVLARYHPRLDEQVSSWTRWDAVNKDGAIAILIVLLCIIGGMYLDRQ